MIQASEDDGGGDISGKDVGTNAEDRRRKRKPREQ